MNCPKSVNSEDAIGRIGSFSSRKGKSRRKMTGTESAFNNTCTNNVNLLDGLFDLLKQAKDDHLLYEGRTYGGGLNKIEPKELARVSLPNHPRLEQIDAIVI